MKIFILLIILAISVSFFATANASSIPIYFGSYTLNAPLSLALILPLGAGLLIFTLVYSAKARRLKSVINNNNNEINDLQETITGLNKRVHQLEIENNKFKVKLGDKPFDDESI